MYASTRARVDFQNSLYGVFLRTLHDQKGSELTNLHITITTFSRKFFIFKTKQIKNSGLKWVLMKKFLCIPVFLLSIRRFCLITLNILRKWCFHFNAVVENILSFVFHYFRYIWSFHADLRFLILNIQSQSTENSSKHRAFINL